MDSAYPAINEDVRQLLERCFAGNSVGMSRSAKGTTTILSVYSRHLPCLFPQHGPGKKHERRILLEDWQTACVESTPMNFIRGLLLSDGCYFVNRTGVYRYPSYDFSNYSADIADLFAEACDLVGIRYRRTRAESTGRINIRVIRRESVEVLLRTVGVKA
jgi:hypothetical protein